MEYPLHADETHEHVIEKQVCQRDTKSRGDKQLNKQLVLPKVINEQVTERKNPTLIFKSAGDRISRILRRKEAEKDLEKIKEQYFYEFFNGNYFR